MESDHVTLYGGDTQYPQMGPGKRGSWEPRDFRLVQREKREFPPIV